MKFVPVLNNENKPLMPTIPSRARKWVRSGKATPFWKKGIFCVRLNESSETKTQQVCVGIDPGSKKHGLTVKSSSHTYLNIQADAVTWVSDKLKTRREMRRARRNRKTPYRKCRLFRKGRNLLASSKARWDVLLRINSFLVKLFPISGVVVEDVSVCTKKGKSQWNTLFSYVETGKSYFYNRIKEKWTLYTKTGYETFQMRTQQDLTKSKNKLADTFNAHCVDSWVLCNWLVGGHAKPDNEEIICFVPLRFTRRQLHKLQPAKGGIRCREGGTMSLGLKRGSLVKHVKYGIVYVGGYMKDRISLHCLKTGKRLTQKAILDDIRFFSHNSWRWN